MDPLVLGVDVGGTKIAVGAVRGAELEQRVERPTELASTSALLDGLEHTVRELIAEAGEPAAIGVGVPSQIDYTTGVVEMSVNIPLAGVPCATSWRAASRSRCSSTTTPTWRPSARRSSCRATTS